MKLLLQLFGGNGLSLFGRSRTKVTAADANNSGGSTGGLTTNKTTHVADVGRHSSTCRQSLVATDVVDNVASRLPDSDKPEIATPSSPGLPVTCWSPKANRICWGSPLSRRSATRRAVAAADELGQHGRTEDAKLPRSRSLIRTNPWLPPSSPPADRRHRGLRRSPSPASGSVSVSCPSTPADSPTKSGRRRRLADSASGGGSGGSEATTPVASEGYCSVSSLCTMSDSATLSTTACSDEMQMSVDSLASLFPTLMSSSSTSFHDEKTSGSGAFCDSVVDSGIAVSTMSVVDNELDPVSTVRHREDFDVVATQSSNGDCSSTSSASSATLKEHLYAVQTALNRDSSDDYRFDVDVFPFSSEVRQRPTAALSTRNHQKRSGDGQTPSPSTLWQSRSVEEISSSLAASVERLHRGRVAVDGAFSRALAEDRRRQRELTRLRRRMVEAQRDVLLGTLRDLRRELDDQCRRLQAAYDAVLTARWPQLHANTAYAATLMCQPAI